MAWNTRILVLGSFTLIIAAALWHIYGSDNRFCAECIPATTPDLTASQPHERLTSGTITAMNSDAIRYISPSTWTVSAEGADPAEPANPWVEPAGTLEFEYTGRELDLLVAVGDYWGYMYVTVDEKPANLLPTIGNNLNLLDETAGYKTFFEPENQPGERPVARWLRVHRMYDHGDAPSAVRIEIWRSWGQIPLRGIAVDALPPEPHVRRLPLLLALLGVMCLLLAATVGVKRAATDTHYFAQRAQYIRTTHTIKRFRSAVGPRLYWLVALLGLATTVVGININLWFVSLCGIGLLALTTPFSLTPWCAVLLFALPFYFGVKIPLFPDRAIDLIDIGVLGGFVLLAGHKLLRIGNHQTNDDPAYVTRQTPMIPATLGNSFNWLKARCTNLTFLIGVLAVWALVSALLSDYLSPALREWRTVFLYAFLFAVILQAAVLQDADRQDQLQILIAAWVAGGTIMAIIGIWQYASGSMLIGAEGVNRIRGWYGSPNNLALYLERCFAVSVALGLLAGSGNRRWIWRICAAVQLVAIVLTFSKGGLFLGLPAIFITLLLAMWMQKDTLIAGKRLRKTGLWLLVFAILGLALIVPFIGTERFLRPFNLNQGTAFFRIQLWRSSIAMALDYLWTGVGPDNFLYSYRSDYLLPTAWQEPNLNHPHNWILDWWTRLGIPGLVLGITLWGRGLFQLWCRLRSVASQTEHAINVGFLAAIAASLLHGLIDISYALPDLMLVWVLLLTLPALQSPRQA